MASAGWPNSQLTPSTLGADYARYTLELAERGYVTIAPDYPLFGDNEVDLEELVLSLALECYEAKDLSVAQLE